MSTPFSSILLFLAAGLIGALGQFLYKSGAEAADGGWTTYVANPRLLLGVGCYVAVMTLFVAAFKKGGSPSVLYPIYATTFVWATIIGAVWYGERIVPSNVVGMVLLLVGVALMGVKP